MTQLIYVICMSPNDLLICRTLNTCYCLFSAPQKQFKVVKKRVLLVNVFCLTRNFLSQLKEKENKYVLRNIPCSKFGKSANHQMTYI